MEQPKLSPETEQVLKENNERKVARRITQSPSVDLSHLEIKDGFPVMPGKKPFVGHVHLLGRNALEALNAAKSKCGPIFWTYYGSQLPVLQILDEAGIDILLNKHTSNSYIKEQMPVVTGESISGTDGQHHRNVRKAISGAFTPKGLTQAKVGEAISTTLEQHLEAWLHTGKVPIFPKTKEIALDAVFRILGIEGQDLSVWRHYYEEFFLGMIPLKIDFPGFPAWRCRKARGWLERQVGQIVAKVRETKDHDSLVGAMTFGKDESGNELTETELIHNILGLGFAGSETTAAVMAWSVFELSRRKDIWDLLCEQVAQLENMPVTQSELNKQVPIAEAIFRETLRLYPPAPFEMRKVSTEFELMGHRIPQGIMVGLSLLHVSRNPERYSHPDEWQPNRWFDEAHGHNPIESCQFGSGPHVCLGRHVATLEGSLFVVKLAQIFGSKGMQPRLVGKMPPPSFLPFYRPSNKAIFSFSG